MTKPAITAAEYTSKANALLQRCLQAANLAPFLHERDIGNCLIADEIGIGQTYLRGLNLNLTVPGHWTDTIRLTIEGTGIMGNDQHFSTVSANMSTGGSPSRYLPLVQAAATFESLWNGGIEELNRNHKEVQPNPVRDGMVYAIQLSDGTFAKDHAGIALAFASAATAQNYIDRSTAFVTAVGMPGYMVCDEFSQPMLSRRSASLPALFISEADAQAAIEQQQELEVRHDWVPRQWQTLALQAPTEIPSEGTEEELST